MIEDAAIVTQRQALLGEGWPQAIAGESFEPGAVMGRDRLGGVEREAGHAGAQWLGGWQGILSRQAELIVRHRRLDGHGQGLLQGGGGLLEQGVGLESVVAPALDDGRQTVGDLQGQCPDVLVGGRG